MNARPVGNIEEIVRKTARTCGCEVPSISEIRREWGRKIIAYCRSVFGKQVRWDDIVGAHDLDGLKDCVQACITQPETCSECTKKVFRHSRDCRLGGYQWQMVPTRHWKGKEYDHDVYVPILLDHKCSKWTEKAEEERQSRQASTSRTSSIGGRF